MRLEFLGGVGTVTGSKFLLHAHGRRILVDCGLFQGYKQLRLRNWASLPVSPSDIDAVVLTHAHIDHSGYLPLLVRNGFSGKVYCTSATADLCRILLPDSGFLQEREADFLNRHGIGKHRPAKPLYTLKDAERALKRLRPKEFGKAFEIEGIRITFRRAGHILGAASIEILSEGRKVLFSGDIGRPNSLTMHDPEDIASTDFLVVESTYGDRTHDQTDPEDVLEDIITRTSRRDGTVIIPAFAVGRTQTLLYHLHRLKAANRIPDLPVYLDSPMAVDATEIFLAHPRDHKLSPEDCRAAFGSVKYVRSTDGSKALDRNRAPKIIISASGMATGGRVLHHLKSFIEDSRNTILFAGFQAGGTRGARLTSGERRIKIHGEYFSVAAEVANLRMLSAHADVDEIIGWLKMFDSPPRQTFITHGEPNASDALRLRIQEELGWACTVPEHNSVHQLGS
ncbi:MBL fold metallo-hydrolase [Parvularcula lutaonensis]|uniref:MBL fold metallo-hydrolase n=1 Tax=Parvularcula lutaonensis TaxID=491923 RepID=A0ABV7M732_9PROT